MSPPEAYPSRSDGFKLKVNFGGKVAPQRHATHGLFSGTLKPPPGVPIHNVILCIVRRGYTTQYAQGARAHTISPLSERTTALLTVCNRPGSMHGKTPGLHNILVR